MNLFARTSLSTLFAAAIVTHTLLWAPTFADADSRIAYVFQGNIAAMNSDGTGYATIASRGALNDHNTEPAFSPDGKRVAFVFNKRSSMDLPRTTIGQIYMVNSDGSNPKPIVANSDGNYSPAFSPDGKSIAFTAVASNGPAISVIRLLNLDSKAPSSAIPNTSGAGKLTFSPDGGQLAFEKGSNIFVVNRDGSGLRLLTVGREPSWSPTGKQIAFSNEVSGSSQRQVHVIAPDGSGLRQIGNMPHGSFQPSYSPDGRRIAFVSNSWPIDFDMGPDDEMAIHVMNADGSNPTGILSRSIEASEPSWSGDGNYVAPNSPITKATEQSTSTPLVNQVVSLITPTRGCLRAGTANVALRIKAKRRQRNTGKRLDVKRVWFYVDKAVQLKDKKKPFQGKLNIQLAPGSSHTFRARIFYTISRKKQQRSKNLVRKFRICN